MRKDIYLAGGCFWGAEHFFQQIDGVVLTEVGFANGHTPEPTYKEVYTDTTGYAETVHIQYDTERVGLRSTRPRSTSREKTKGPAIAQGFITPIPLICPRSAVSSTRFNARRKRLLSLRWDRCRISTGRKTITRTT